MEDFTLRKDMKIFVFLSTLNKIGNYSEKVFDNHIYYWALRNGLSPRYAQKRAQGGTSLAG